jgi:hypothetical protein
MLGFENYKAFGNDIRFYIERTTKLRKLGSSGIFAPGTSKNFNPMVVSCHPANMRLSRSRSSQLSCHKQTDPLPKFDSTASIGVARRFAHVTLGGKAARHIREQNLAHYPTSPSPPYIQLRGEDCRNLACSRYSLKHTTGELREGLGRPHASYPNKKTAGSTDSPFVNMHVSWVDALDFALAV